MTCMYEQQQADTQVVFCFVLVFWVFVVVVWSK